MNTFLLSLGGLIAGELLYLLVGRVLARRLAERLADGDFDRSVRGMGQNITNVITTVLLLIALRVVWRPVREVHTFGAMALLAVLAFLFTFAVLMLRGVMICLIRRREALEKQSDINE
ncbi:MAG: hypothetical protein MSB10_09010 [Clostridiales bacterium]|uniref:hypothetical protein n=1 Tax=Flavonifractor porci TaxID=3133422 RepID=UPI0030B2EF45|nr:hypothetical protein [Clostridiales bacterium]